MIFASNNKGKLKEIKDIFYEYDVKSLKDVNLNVYVIEDKDTFYLNAQKKAKEIYSYIKEPVIADDSGLCINAFDGWPGVLTHRFLGENKSDLDRNNAILDKMKNIVNREAKVVCCLVYYDGIKELVGVGEIDGVISDSIRGDNGFGFDSIFELNGKTLAELSSDEKNMLSARKKAAEDLKNKLNDYKKENYV